MPPKGSVRQQLGAAGYSVENLNAKRGVVVRGPNWVLKKNGQKAGHFWTEVDAWLKAAEHHFAICNFQSDKGQHE